MLDLKPCPFCGKDAQIAPDEIGSGGQHVPPYHAGCFRGAGCGVAFTADDPDEAIAEWNRRPLSTITPAEVGGLVERLRERAESYRMGGPSSEHTAALLDEAATALAAKDAELAAKEEARAEQWRLRREAGGSRDVARAACDTMRIERDEARAQLAEARKALEPFALVTILPTGEVVGMDRLWFDAARRALTGGKNGQ